MLELTYQRQKHDYEAVRGSLIGVMLLMIKLDLCPKNIGIKRTLPDYINDYAITEKVIRVNGRAKRF